MSEKQFRIRRRKTLQVRVYDLGNIYQRRMPNLKKSCNPLRIAHSIIFVAQSDVVNRTLPHLFQTDYFTNAYACSTSNSKPSLQSVTSSRAPPVTHVCYLETQPLYCPAFRRGVGANTGKGFHKLKSLFLNYLRRFLLQHEKFQRRFGCGVAVVVNNYLTLHARPLSIVLFIHAARSSSEHTSAKLLLCTFCTSYHRKQHLRMGVALHGVEISDKYIKIKCRFCVKMQLL